MRINDFGKTDGILNAPASGNSNRAGEPAVSADNSGHDGIALSKLSSVLNGLEMGATAGKRRLEQVMNSVRSGAYKVNPLAVSRRIIDEALASA